MLRSIVPIYSLTCFASNHGCALKGVIKGQEPPFKGAK